MKMEDWMRAGSRRIGNGYWIVIYRFGDWRRMERLKRLEERRSRFLNWKIERRQGRRRSMERLGERRTKEKLGERRMMERLGERISWPAAPVLLLVWINLGNYYSSMCVAV